jgi:hypothetical protein
VRPSYLIRDVDVTGDQLTFAIDAGERRAGGLRGEVTRWRRMGEVFERFAIATQPSPPRPLPEHALFVVDRSRSTAGSLREAERNLVHEILGRLSAAATFNAVLFDSQPVVLFDQARSVTGETVRTMDGELMREEEPNGTDVLGALRQAGELIRSQPGPWLVALITDDTSGFDQSGSELIQALGARGEAQVLVATVGLESGRQRWAEFGRAVGGTHVHVAPVLGECCRDGDEPSTAERAHQAVGLGLRSLQRGGDYLNASVDPMRDDWSLLRPGEAWISKPANSSPSEQAMRVHGTRGTRSWIRPVAVMDGGSWTPLAAGSVLAVGNQHVLLDMDERWPGVDVISACAHVVGSLDRSIMTRELRLSLLPLARQCLMREPVRTPDDLAFTTKAHLEISIARGEVVAAHLSGSAERPALLSCLQDAVAVLRPPAAESDRRWTGSVDIRFERTAEDPMHITDQATLGELTYEVR